MSNKLKNLAKDSLVGKIFPTNNCGDVTIIDYEGAHKVLVQFSDGTTSYYRANHIKSGNIKNPLHATVQGVGFHGIGPHKSKVDYKQTKEYSLWKNMLERCYNSNKHKKQPTYKDCTVDRQWHNFQEFAEWCQHQIGFSREGWEIDKDILVKGNRVYAPDTCAFVPKEINLLTRSRKNSRGDHPFGTVSDAESGRFRACWWEAGVHRRSKWYAYPLQCFEIYKENKERIIKEFANKWKDQIDERVYLSLMNYEVEADD